MVRNIKTVMRSFILLITLISTQNVQAMYLFPEAAATLKIKVRDERDLQTIDLMRLIGIKNLLKTFNKRDAYYLRIGVARDQKVITELYAAIKAREPQLELIHQELARRESTRSSGSLTTASDDEYSSDYESTSLFPDAARLLHITVNTTEDLEKLSLSQLMAVESLLMEHNSQDSYFLDSKVAKKPHHITSLKQAIKARSEQLAIIRAEYMRRDAAMSEAEEVEENLEYSSSFEEEGAEEIPED